MSRDPHIFLIGGAVIAFLLFSYALIQQSDRREQEADDTAHARYKRHCDAFAARVCKILEVRRAGSWLGDNVEALVECRVGTAVWRYAWSDVGTLRAGDLADPERVHCEQELRDWSKKHP